jgi:hypothetical protein
MDIDQMNRRQKIIIILGLGAFIVVALIVRHEEAGYIALLKGDYNTAVREFSLKVRQGDSMSTYFTGFLYDTPGFRMVNKNKAAHAYLKSAKLGSVDGAIHYLYLVSTLKDRHLNCSVLVKLFYDAASTHILSAIFLNFKFFSNGKCTKKDRFEAAQYFKWAGEISGPIRGSFEDYYVSMSKSEQKEFNSRTFKKPHRISANRFLNIFFSKLHEVTPINFGR